MSGKILRFVNFLLDTSIYLAFMICFLIVFKSFLERENVKWISALVYFMYYFIPEFLFGRTPAKMITHSKVIAVSENEDFFSVRIFLRTITRFIPLDVLSYLFTYRGLHDWISKTTIIKL